MRAKQHTMEQDFMHQTEQVEFKLDAIEVVISKICQRVAHIGKEAVVLPHLHEILVLCRSVFEKVNTEAARIGLIKRKL